MLCEKFGELFCFLLRKSLTCCRTSQLQGKVVPTTADEGVAVFEFIEEVGYEAIFRWGVTRGDCFFRFCLCYFRYAFRRHFEGDCTGIVVGFGMPGVETGLRQYLAFIIVRVTYVCADRSTYGCIKLFVIFLHVFGTDAYQHFVPFFGDADKGGGNKGERLGEEEDFPGASVAVVEVDAEQFAVLLKLAPLRRVRCCIRLRELDGTAYRLSVSVLRLQVSRAGIFQATVVFCTTRRKAVGAAYRVNKIVDTDGVWCFAPHAWEFGNQGFPDLLYFPYLFMFYSRALALLPLHASKVWKTFFRYFALLYTCLF